MINGRYKKIKKLGEGSQGVVFQVEDTKDNNTMFYFLLNKSS